MREVNEFYNDLDKFWKEMITRRTDTVSDRAFKDKVKEIFTSWKTNIKPQIEQTESISKSKIDAIDLNLTKLYKESRRRVADISVVVSLLDETTEPFFSHVVIPLKTRENMPQRGDLAKRLNAELEHFAVASEYFEEAKSCFEYGFFRASTIMAISALESCLRTDFNRVKGKEYRGKLFNLLNRYFTGDLKRLPTPYEDFSKTYVKIRNSVTHPEEFDYSETIVFNVLSTVMELMKALENLY